MDCVHIFVFPPVVNLRVGIHFIQALTVVPVFPLFHGDQIDSFLHGSEVDQSDEIDEKPAFHRSQFVAFDDVLHVVEQQFDVISLPLCIQ